MRILLIKPTTIYLPEETETNLQKLADQTGKSIPEIIQELIINYFTEKPQKLSKSVGKGSNEISDLSSKTEQLLWTVDPDIAKAYREAEPEKQQKIQMFLNLMLKTVVSQKPLLDIMEEASQQAISNGMTPEILESILNDEN